MTRSNDPTHCEPVQPLKKKVDATKKNVKFDQRIHLPRPVGCIGSRSTLSESAHSASHVGDMSGQSKGDSEPQHVYVRPGRQSRVTPMNNTTSKPVTSGAGSLQLNVGNCNLLVADVVSPQKSMTEPVPGTSSGEHKSKDSVASKSPSSEEQYASWLRQQFGSDFQEFSTEWKFDNMPRANQDHEKQVETDITNASGDKTLDSNTLVPSSNDESNDERRCDYMPGEKEHLDSDSDLAVLRRTSYYLSSDDESYEERRSYYKPRQKEHMDTDSDIDSPGRPPSSQVSRPSSDDESSHLRDDVEENVDRLFNDLAVDEDLREFIERRRKARALMNEKLKKKKKKSHKSKKGLKVKPGKKTSKKSKHTDHDEKKKRKKSKHSRKYEETSEGDNQSEDDAFCGYASYHKKHKHRELKYTENDIKPLKRKRSKHHKKSGRRDDRSHECAQIWVESHGQAKKRHRHHHKKSKHTERVEQKLKTGRKTQESVYQHFENGHKRQQSIGTCSNILQKHSLAWEQRDTDRHLDSHLEKRRHKHHHKKSSKKCSKKGFKDW